jgi:hypothetical protein
MSSCSHGNEPSGFARSSELPVLVHDFEIMDFTPQSLFLLFCRVRWRQSRRQHVLHLGGVRVPHRRLAGAAGAT